MEKALEKIILEIAEKKPKSRNELNFFVTKAASRIKISQPPTRDLLEAYQNLVKKKSISPNPVLEKLFHKASIRSNSGIAVVTTLLKPYTCPGKCVYCPTEVRMPKSYIASEPAAARSLRFNFDPYILMQSRIEMLEKNGHDTDKIEYITKGGTWNAYPLKYQYWFMLESFRACNDLSRTKKTKEKYTKLTEHSPLVELQKALEKEQRYNEHTHHRIIGVTFETRPDAISPLSIWHMRTQGCTRVELGLQAPDDKILTLIKRGHTTDQFRSAMYLLRKAGFKVDLHFMPDLPGTTAQHDVEMYKFIFDDVSLRPDMIKIYPNTVVPSAELHQWFLDGRFTPYSEKELFDALIEMKLATPRYCRISRLIRDIPATEIEAGNTVTNLRELLEYQMKKMGQKCVCLRCREIARQEKNLPAHTEPQLFVDTYKTIGGTEYFITFEDPHRVAVYGFLRFRIPCDEKQTEKQEWLQKATTEIKERQFSTLFPELKNCAFIRELHVYGRMVQVGKTDIDASQHKGLGKKLMAAAESIVRENGFKKCAVISGVGVRGYYRKLGYKKIGTYMVKKLDLKS